MNIEKEIERINKVIENGGKEVIIFGRREFKHLTPAMKTILQRKALALFVQEPKLLWTGKLHPAYKGEPVAFMGTYIASFHGKLKEDGRYGQPRYT